MNQHSYFRSSGYLNENIILTESEAELDLTKLPPFLRTLLVTDGTVTKSLEAWFWERVKIETMSNTLETLQDKIIGLDVNNGDNVLRREVILKGVQTESTYAAARSTVSLKFLPEEIKTALEKGEIGIGEILREKGVETYRDIFNINYYPSLPKGDNLLSLLKADVLSRSYRIRVNSHPAIIVTEFFPINTYR